MRNHNHEKTPRVENAREKPCIHCGETDYTWANVTYFGHNHKEGNVQLREGNPYPRPKGETQTGWEAFLREPLLARKCNACGNVQLFTSDANNDLH